MNIDILNAAFPTKESTAEDEGSYSVPQRISRAVNVKNRCPLSVLIRDKISWDHQLFCRVIAGGICY